MGRPPRVDFSGGLYHALNCGNAKNPIFFKEEDYAAFERIVVVRTKKVPDTFYLLRTSLDRVSCGQYSDCCLFIFWPC